MPRQIPWGTPVRSSRMMTPRDDRRLLRGSVAGGVVLLVLVAALYVLGARRVVSPGDLASAHAHIDAKCSQCHDEGKNVSDVRCGRCHDASGVGRMEHASHVLLGSGDVAKAADAPSVACVRCHTDHRGLKYRMRVVDDRECAPCHRGQFAAPLGLAPLTTFQRHPEFAAYRAQRTSGVGLQFNHVTHFDYVLRERRGVKAVDAEQAKKAALETCQRCHFLGEDRRAFTAISFNTSCSGSMCHTRNKGFLENDTRDVTLAHVVSTVPGIVSPPGEGDNETKVFTNLSHRDPWVMFNAAWLRASIDPAGTSAEREALRGSIAWLDQVASTPMLFANASVDDLRAWERALADEVASLVARAGVRPSAESTDLSRTAADLQDLLKQLSAAAGMPAGAIDDSASAVSRLAGGSQSGDADAAQRFEARRQELIRLLATIKNRAVRAGDKGLAQRADDLRARVERAKGGPTNTPVDTAALRGMLASLDEVFKLTRETPDPGLQADLQLLAGLRDYARTRGLGGLDPGEFEMRRQEISRLVDTLIRSPNAAVRTRAGVLRARLLALQPSDAAGADRSGDRRRLLERVRLEIALRSSRDGATPPPTPLRERQVAQQLIDQLRPRLALMDRVAAAPVASDADRALRRQTLTALLAPCLKCHLFDGEDENRVYPVGAPGPNGVPTRTPVDVLARTGLKLAPVGAAEPVMKRAVFTHAPHVTTTDCARCHGSVVDGRRTAERGVIVGSTLASDLNSPGVATCQSCHTRSGARQDCGACHVYHPPSAERLLRAVWSPN